MRRPLYTGASDRNRDSRFCVYDEMESLKGKAIIIGKEPGAGRLLVAIPGMEQTSTVGSPGSVPNSVSRCKPLENTAHASITIDPAGILTLANLKTQNVTYVNGIEIATKNIDFDSTVELGKDKYKVDIASVLECARQIIKREVQIDKSHKSSKDGKFNISHLEQVWNDYQSGLRKLRESQKKINLIRSGCGIFTMCAMPCIFFLGPIGYVLTGVGVAGNIYSFVGLKNDKTTETQEQLTEEFQDNYVCPNPKCNKFLGNLSYKLLKKQYSMHCPYCKCEFEEK